MALPRKNNFAESARTNKATYMQYYNRLMELSISMFEWKNLPETVDARFLELTLFGDGMALFFADEVLGPLALQTMIGGELDVYRIPIVRTAYAPNGYQARRTAADSVIIWNNLIHTNSVLDVEQFAKRLYNLDRAIDVNANAQKTPVLITCEETQRLTLKNIYMQYDGNAPVIYGNKALNPDSLKVLSTGAPYVADKLYTLKTQIWNEALTYLGISNVSYDKKERMFSLEVAKTQGGTIASRYSRLEARRQACDQINRLFKLDIWCDYRDDYQIADNNPDVIPGEPSSTGTEKDGGDVE